MEKQRKIYNLVIEMRDGSRRKESFRELAMAEGRQRIVETTMRRVEKTRIYASAAPRAGLV